MSPRNKRRKSMYFALGCELLTQILLPVNTWLDRIFMGFFSLGIKT